MILIRLDEQLYAADSISHFMMGLSHPAEELGQRPLCASNFLLERRNSYTPRRRMIKNEQDHAYKSPPAQNFNEPTLQLIFREIKRGSLGPILSSPAIAHRREVLTFNYAV